MSTIMATYSNNTLGPIGTFSKMLKAVKDSLRWTCVGFRYWVRELRTMVWIIPSRWGNVSSIPIHTQENDHLLAIAKKIMENVDWRHLTTGSADSRDKPVRSSTGNVSPLGYECSRNLIESSKIVKMQNYYMRIAF